MKSYSFTMPEPPSANRWWRNVHGRMILSKEARDYKKAIAKVGAAFLLHGPIKVEIDWYRSMKSGDLDKRLGVALDALQGVFYVSDSQIVELRARRFDTDKDHPRLAVTVSQIDDLLL